jgi:putative toxin-antitoxin system antitoxin component (TIGR02293 family)
VKKDTIKNETFKAEEEDQLTIAEEPVEVYMANHATQPILAWRVLGGSQFAGKVPESSLAFYQIGEKGIRKSSVKALAEIIGIPMVEMCDLLNVSYKTLARKGNEDILDGWISSHSIEIAQTIARGLALFEDREKLKRWLNKPNRALKGKIPLELLKYHTGIRLVNQMMMRIEEGIHT